jgi:hypothetical protein
MSEPVATTAPPGDLGVVEPIRIPGADRIRSAWRPLPPVGRAFVALAVVDLVLRALRFNGVWLGIDVDLPFTALSALTHTVVLLLPVAVLLRRPDAAAATPWILRGAIVIALVELLGEHVRAVLPTDGDIGGPWIVAQLASGAAWTAGYAMLAIGLRRQAREAPRPAIAGFANLVAAAIVLAATAGLIGQLVLVEAELFPGTRLLGVLAAIPQLALAFLARVVVRGTEDDRRPRIARSLATAGVALIAVDAAVLMLLSIYVLLQASFFPAWPLPIGGFGLGWFGSGLAMVLLVVAFGLGLGDPSGRIRRLDGEPDEGETPAGERVRWPAPGGDVPEPTKEPSA